jgi:hypothetical protein
MLQKNQLFIYLIDCELLSRLFIKLNIGETCFIILKNCNHFLIVYFNFKIYQ